jgi:hypothetical protein
MATHIQAGASEYASEIYHADAGPRHGSITSLSFAFKWKRIIYRCWKTQTADAKSVYLKAR